MQFHLLQETLYTTVAILDRFAPYYFYLEFVPWFIVFRFLQVEVGSVSRNKLQLVGVVEDKLQVEGVVKDMLQVVGMEDML